jgi:signal transduction histidine kinase
MRLRTGLQAALAYVLLLAIIALGIPLALSLKTRVNDEVRSQAQGQADLVAATASDLLGPRQRAELATVARTAAAAVRGRVLIVNAAGTVIADSAGSGELGTSYRQRPEISRALQGNSVQLQRSSRTLGKEILATAVPVIHNRLTVGAVRITQSVASVQSAVNRVELGLGIVGAVVLALGLLIGSVIAGQIARPLRRLERVASDVAEGDLEARALVEGFREQRSLGVSFNVMTDRIRRLLDSQRAFVADASHQLRTPLTALRLRLEEATAADDVGPGARAELEAGVREVDRLAEIIEELLVLSRAGEREMPGERLELEPLLAETLARWRPAAAERRIGLESRPASGALNGANGAVWCARADAERILDVLMENAIGYSAEGSLVTLAAAGGRVEIADGGPGLSEADLASIFERFHRGSAGRAHGPGTGLGLAIARELARSWGGEVELANRDGAGAVATLLLPEAPL